MTITTRAAKGGPLTNAELDANFTDLRDLKAPIDAPNFTGAATFAGGVSIGAAIGLKQLYVAGGGYDLMMGASGGNLFGYASQAISVVFNSTATPLGIGTNAGQPLIFGTNQVERMRLDASGNLGIGTTAPRSRLSLGSGAVNSTGIPGASPSLRLYDNGGGDIYGMGCSSVGGMEISANQAGQAIRFYAGTDSTSPTERLRIGGNGNILIGTTTDDGTNKLQVNGPVKSGGFLTSGGGLSVTGSNAPGSGGSLEFGYGGGAGYFQSYNRTGGAYTPLGVYASTITFGVGGGAATALFLPASGNVLVGGGADNGADKLQVTGNLSVGTNGAYGTQASPLRTQMAFRGYQNNRSAAIRSYDMTGTYATGGGLEFLVNQNMGADSLVSAMTVTSTARVLIGTSTDNGSSTLQVNGPGYFASSVTASAFSSSTGGITTNLGADINGSYVESVGPNNLRFYTGGVERVRIRPTGNFLIGTSTDNGTDTLQVNGSSQFTDNLRVNAGNDVGFGLNGGIAIQRKAGDALGFLTASAERMRVDASGNVLIGALVYGSGGASNSAIGFRVGDTMITYGANNQAATASNASATCMKVGSMTTGRSISTYGTINASGADYAEYMLKAEGTGSIPKGAVVGVDSQGNLTDKYADAVSFVLKSTNPSYVGGDTWGADLDAEVLEAARAKVDRIAFAGQVPVNVFGCKPGQYIVPNPDDAGITGVAVSEDDMTLKQYLRAVGIVQNILPDGRANVRVKVA